MVHRKQHLLNRQLGGAKFVLLTAFAVVAHSQLSDEALAISPDNVFAGKGFVVVAYDGPGTEGTEGYGFMFQPADTIASIISQGVVLRLSEQGYRASIVAIEDPSVAYALEAVNLTDEPGFHAFSIILDIPPLISNSFWAELTVELVDSSGDGDAYLYGNVGDEGAIQSVTLTNLNTSVSQPLGSPLGMDISQPGTHTFALGSASGPETQDDSQLFLATRFTLSPGDTAVFSSRFIIDEGKDIPFAEVPDFADPNNGPFFNVFNVPDYTIPDNAFIGSQTQVNLSEGGSIGERFNIDALMNNRLNDNTFDVEVNITGGTVGDQFTALSGTTVNISGGTTNGFFNAGSTSGQSTDVEVNITGGRVGAGFNSGIQAYRGSVVNIAGGTVSPLKVYGGAVNISGGSIDKQIVGNGLGIEIISGVVNISGGAFDNAHGQTFVFDGVLNVSGGSFLATHPLRVSDGGTVNLFGTEFLLDGVPIDGLEYGEAFEITNREVTLTGLLGDGSPLSFDLNSDSVSGEDRLGPDALLTVTLILPGDYNDDGVVNAADYTVWRDNGGTVAEFDAWKNGFGGGANDDGAATGAAVPEPAAAVLWVMAGGAAWAKRGRKRGGGA